MLRFLLITILLTEYALIELKAEAAPSIDKKESEKKFNEELQSDHIKQSQDDVWIRPGSVQKTKNLPPHLSKNKNGAFPSRKRNHGDGPLVEKIANRKRSSMLKFSGIQYSPRDIAEYITRTRDEEGVVLAIRDLLRSKTLIRKDAAPFLQAVKDIISKLRTTQGTPSNEENSVKYFAHRRSQQLLKEAEIKKELRSSGKDGITTDVPLSTTLPFAEANSLDSSTSTIEESSIPGNRSKLIKHTLPPADLHNEKIMRKMIYRLAKEMFLHSLQSGDKAVKRTLARLITILDKDIHDEMVPPKVKEIILESISAALVDSLKIYPGIVTQQHGGSYLHSSRQRRSSSIRARRA